MLDLHQGFTGQELKGSSPYVRLGMQQVQVLVDLFSGKFAQAGSRELAVVRGIGQQLAGDLGSLAHNLYRRAEERLLESLKPPSARKRKQAQGPDGFHHENPFRPSTARSTASEGTPSDSVPAPAVPLSAAAPPRVSDVPVEAVREQMQKGDPLLFVDVREPVETLGGVIPGARLIPLATVLERIGELRDQPASIIVYCASGQRSRAAAQQLLDRGCKQVASLRGGMRAWAQAGGEIVAPPPQA